MLSPAEQDLVAREPTLPGLPLLLDAGRLADRLGLGPLRALYLRYKPATSCVLAFRGGEETGLPAFAAMAYPPERYATLRARPKWDPTRATFLDDLATVVVPMTLDPKLPGLLSISDPERRGGLLATVGGPVVAEAGVRLLRYNPGRRAVLRLDGPHGPVALAKAYTEADWTYVLEGARLAGTRGGARLLGAVEDARLILSEWIEGRPLWSEAGGLAGTAEVEAAGCALARLHSGPAAAARRIGIAEELEELAAAAQNLAGLLPALGERARDLAKAISERLEGHERRTALLHGDFSADQVVLGSTGPVLIDWDRATVGDPARDLSSFLARLDVQAIDGDLSHREAAGARQALLAGYGASSSDLLPGLPTQHARALFLLLPEGFRHRRPDWPERAAAILARIEALLPASRQAVIDGLDPLTGRATDPARMGPLVTTATGLPADSVAEIRLLRRKPGRRALLRYGLRDGAGPAALIGKLRARGPDRHTPVLHADLRRSGLDGRAPHWIGVPRPMGEVEELHLWLQEEVPGRRIADYLQPGVDPTAAHRAGNALARLHDSPAEPARHRWTLGDEMDVLRRSLGELAEALPAMASRIHALAAASAEVADRLRPDPEVLIHRDWHPDQILLDGDSVWILDLDLCARGDPAVDLGNFLAHVTELAIRRHGDPFILQIHEQAFLEGYATARAIEEARVAALKALSLARLVAISQRIADRRPATGAILEMAERLVFEVGRRTGARMRA